jgi:hypothetical protein
LEITTSDAPVRERHLFQVTLDDSMVFDAGFSRVGPGKLEHLVGHVQLRRRASLGRPHQSRGRDRVHAHPPLLKYPYFPGKRYLDWDLPDPKDQPIEQVRAIRDDIQERIGQLVSELDRTNATPTTWIT